jgi:hypothetical protein
MCGCRSLRDRAIPEVRLCRLFTPGNPDFRANERPGHFLECIQFTQTTVTNSPQLTPDRQTVVLIHHKTWMAAEIDHTIVRLSQSFSQIFLITDQTVVLEPALESSVNEKNRSPHRSSSTVHLVQPE